MVFSLVGEVVNLIVWILQTVGLPGLFVLMMVESFGIPPIPSEVILTFSGFLVAEGVFPLPGTIAVALVGGLVGSYVAYALGRWGREKITGIGLGALRIEPSHLETMDRWFARHGRRRSPSPALCRWSGPTSATRRVPQGWSLSASVSTQR